MLKKVSATALACSVLLVAGCGQKKEAAEAPVPAAASSAAPTVNATMTQVFSTNAQTIWDITSRAFNAKGDGLDASKLSDKDLGQMAVAAGLIRDRAQALAAAPHVVAAAPGEHILGEDSSHPGAKGTYDAASVQQVQSLIDGDPALFKKKAQALAAAMDALAKASKTKDIKTIYQVSADLDERCDGCHQPFWGTDDPPPFPKK